MGGPTRNDHVSSFILNSGDALLMSGACRRFFHGVPRILDYCVESFEGFELADMIKNSRININVRQVF